LKNTDKKKEKKQEREILEKRDINNADIPIKKKYLDKTLKRLSDIEGKICEIYDDIIQKLPDKFSKPKRKKMTLKYL
jgi:hypothetical protein